MKRRDLLSGLAGLVAAPVVGVAATAAIVVPAPDLSYVTLYTPATLAAYDEAIEQIRAALLHSYHRLEELRLVENSAEFERSLVISHAL